MKYKIKSVVLDHAVADALGVPVEFASREELDQNPVEDMEGFGTYPFVLWELLKKPSKEAIRLGLCRAYRYYKHEPENGAYTVK